MSNFAEQRLQFRVFSWEVFISRVVNYANKDEYAIAVYWKISSTVIAIYLFHKKVLQLIQWYLLLKVLSFFCYNNGPFHKIIYNSVCFIQKSLHIFYLNFNVLETTFSYTTPTQ